MYQPICPIRSDQKCMGAMCAWSRHHVNDKGMWLFTCGMVPCEDGAHGLAVIAKHEQGKDPVERT